MASNVRPSKALKLPEGQGLRLPPLLGVAPCGRLFVAVARLQVLVSTVPLDVVHWLPPHVDSTGAVAQL